MESSGQWNATPRPSPTKRSSHMLFLPFLSLWAETWMCLGLSFNHREKDNTQGDSGFIWWTTPSPWLVTWNRPTAPPWTVTSFLLHCQVKWKSLSRVWLFATPWTIQSWNSPGQNTGVGSLSLLQGIFPTQGLNPDLLHCRWILYQLSHKGSPCKLSSLFHCTLEVSSLWQLNFHPT